MSQEIKQTKCCPNCGAQLESGAAFCGGCGYKFPEEAERKREENQMEKNKTRMWTIMGAAVCAAAILFWIFGGSPEKQVLGYWEPNSKGVDVLFEEDGVIMVDGMPATYYIDDDKGLHIKAFGLFSAADLEWDRTSLNDNGWFVDGNVMKLGEDYYSKKE